jgi:cis-3-alkyl-4-acyloxetan-2-one decarboxylase
MLERLPAPPMPPWLAEMVPFERYLVDVGGARMHVMETGSGLPVVLLHGNPTWGFLYRRVARELRREPMRLIMPDLVGLGFSDKPPAEAHSLDRHIGWMARLFDALGLERAVVALQDWGGPIGAGALAAGPARRLGLVVMNTVLTPPRPGFRPSAFHRFARMPYVSEAAFRGLGFPQSLMGRFVPLAKLSRDERRAYRYPLRRFADNAAPLALARMVPDSPEHASIPALERCRDFVERFDGPAVIVWGDRDPVLGGVRSWMQKLFPRAPLIRTRAGHFLQEEVPASIAGAIRAVAAELP